MRASRVIFVSLISITLIAVCVGSSSTNAATAAVQLTPTVAPYEDATYQDALWGMVSGETWPDAFPGEWAASGVEEAAVAGSTLPALSTLGTIGLGVVAFDVGWKIGRAIDTKWLHLSGDVGTFTPTSSVLSGSFVFVNNVFTQALGYPDGIWMLQLRSASSTIGSRTWYDPAQSGTHCALNSSGGPSTSAAAIAALYNAEQNFDGPGERITVPRSVITAEGVYGCQQTRGIDDPPLTAFVRTPMEMTAALVHSLPVAYTGQSYAYSSTIPAPSETQAHIQAIRDAISTGGSSLENEFNAALDPLDYERPGPDGSPPGGLKVTWPTPNPSETYAQYISRLQTVGYLGDITQLTLDDGNGDPEYGASGIPCTSITPGATIGANDPVTIYVNPASMSDDPSPSLPACPGHMLTSKTTTKCTLHTIDWASQRATNPDFYDTMCSSAWTYFWANQTFVDDSGNIIDASQVHFLNITGNDIRDPQIIAYLQGIDPDLSHWEHATTGTFSDTYPFQVHFWWNTVTNTLRFDFDFKIRFNSVYMP
jgi:hypothetical protein